MPPQRPNFLSFAGRADLDEGTAYAVCRMIDVVGYQIKADWDWDWLKERHGDYRSLIDRSLAGAAWNLLVQKDCLSLQTTSDEMPQMSTIEPLEGLTNLRSLVLQNNLVTDLRPSSGMVKLRYLNCYGNRIADLAPLKHLRSLEVIELGDNPLASLRVLEQLPNLRKLAISTNQVECLLECKRLPSIQVLEVRGEGSVANLTQFPEMPFLKVLRVFRLRDTAGIERFASLGTLELSQGDFPRLEGLEKLKGLTHCEASTSRSLSLQPLSGLYALRSLQVSSPNVQDLSALARLPVLHEVHISDKSSFDRGELDALCRALTPWGEEFRTPWKKVTPSLDVEIVSQETFDF